MNSKNSRQTDISDFVPVSVLTSSSFSVPRKRVQLHFNVNGDRPSRTDPSHKDSCDVDLILRKYSSTGVVSHTRSKPGDFVDLVNFPSFQDSFDKVIAAQAAFEALPSAVRTRFYNDPANLIEFVSNRDNFDEAVRLGLLPPPANPSPSGNEDRKKFSSGEAANSDDDEVIVKKGGKPVRP